MTDIEHRLREAMHAAVEGEHAPADMVDQVMRRHRRYLGTIASAAVIGVAVAVVVSVAVAARGTGPGHVGPGKQPTASATTPSSPEPTATSPSSPAPSVTSSRPRTEPGLLRGLPMPPAEDLRVFLTGRAPAWYSLATGQATPIAGLPPSRFPYALLRVAGGWAAEPSPNGHACLPDCPDPRLPVFYIADGSVQARRIGVTKERSPGNERGVLWLATYPPGTTDVSMTSATAQQVTSSGKRVGSPVRLPAGYLIQQEVGSYLLLSPVLQGPGPVIYKLWNPATQQVIQTFQDVIAAGAHQIAWASCGHCGVRVYDLNTGLSFTIGLQAGSRAYDGSFSADGRLLAVHLSGGITRDGRATLARIGVIDTARRHLRVLSGSTVGVDLPESLTFGWQGHELIAAVTGARQLAQIASWRPGAARMFVRRLSLPPGMTLVVGEYG
jgi:hypothetical protein